jgi:phosphatidylinositol alpha-mannosyltransferase
VIIAPGVKPQPSTLEKRKGSLLFVGRVDDHRKGFDILESAFVRISRVQPCVSLDVVGQCSESTRARLYRRFGSKVTVHGVVDDRRLYELYGHSALFVMPSRYEGYGMPYFEAMASGTPVVATECGPLPEIIPSSCGYVVPVEDAITLGNVILSHFNDPVKAKFMSTCCLNHSSSMDWAAVVERHATLYHQLGSASA